MNRWSISIIVLLACTSLVASQLHKTLEGHHELHRILSETLKGNENAKVHLSNMMTQIKMREDNDYVPVTDIGTNINTLKTELDNDQVVDDVQFEADTARINEAIQNEETQIAALKVTRQTWKDRIVAQTAELETIQNIYESDRAAYLSRVNKQQELINVLNELIDQSTNGLLNNPSVPSLDGTGITESLAQIKQIGRGHPIEALVQLNSLFSKSDAQNLISRFEALEQAVTESQAIDRQKEDKNLELYNLLTQNIEQVLIPEAEAQIQQLNDEIKQHRVTIAQLEEELRQITVIYNYRKEQRSNAISYTVQASEALAEELAELVKSEIIIQSK